MPGATALTVTSGAGRAITHVSASHYAAAKAGVLGFTRHLAREVADRGVTVNAVAPGTVLVPDSYDDAQRERLAAATPLRRLGRPEDAIEAILYLLERGDFVTGDTLVVDGGRLLR